MKSHTYINLAVKDLEKTKNFCSLLGFEFVPKYSDDKAVCVKFNEGSYAMLITEEFFKNFTQKELVNAFKATESLLAISVESRERVDELLKIALANGATEDRKPQEYDFMYGRSFNDLDGHIWEFFWMDENAHPANK